MKLTTWNKGSQCSRWHNNPSVEGQKTCANHKHDPCCNNNKHSKGGGETEKQNPDIGFQYSKSMKGIHTADHYSVITQLWGKLSNSWMYLLNCCSFQCIFVFKTLKTNQKVKYNNFLHEVARSWISEVQNPNEFSFNELQWPEKQPPPLGPKRARPLSPDTLQGFQQSQIGQNCCWWRGQEELSCKRL